MKLALSKIVKELKINVKTAIACGLIIGILIGIVKGVFSIYFNRYISYGMYNIAVYSLRSGLNYWILLLSCVFILFALASTVCSVLIPYKNKGLAILLGCIVGGCGFLKIAYYMNRFIFKEYWKSFKPVMGWEIRAGFIEPKVIFTNLGITIGSILAGWLIYRFTLAIVNRVPRVKDFFKMFSLKLGMGILMFLLILNLFVYIYQRKTYTEGPNVILISIDDLRADHLRCYGYRRDTSSAIDRFAKEGILFSHAFSQAHNTPASHATMLSSLYPSTHGSTGRNDRLSHSIIMLAEILKENGYTTGGFVDGGYLSPVYGFDQGFDLYDARGKGIERINSKVFKWLEKNRQRKFFLFLHCFDVHFPYEPPPPYDKIFVDPEYKGNFILTSEIIEGIKEGRINKLRQEDIEYMLALYDGGIAYTDMHIGKLLDKLNELNLAHRTIVIITADHGEEFMEHGSIFHFQLYYTITHVPLIIRIPKEQIKEKVIDEAVELIDITPTILDLLNIPQREEIQGDSLLPLISGEKEKRNYYAFSERPGSGGRRAIMTDRYQALYTLKTGELELYDFQTDPREKNNLISERQNIAAKLKEELFKWMNYIISSKQGISGGKVHIDERTKERLRSLGYLQ